MFIYVGFVGLVLVMFVVGRRVIRKINDKCSVVCEVVKFVTV
jgi:hypothetical protein